MPSEVPLRDPPQAGRALRAQAFCPGKTLNRAEFTSGRPNQIRGPRGALPRWARDIILADCLINYYAQ